MANLTWTEVAALIRKMKKGEKDQPALCQDENTGRYFGFAGIERDDGGTIYLQPASEYAPQPKGAAAVEELASRIDEEDKKRESEAEYDFEIERRHTLPSRFYALTDRAVRFMGNARKQDDHYIIHEAQAQSWIEDIEKEGMSWKAKAV
jgi:hypothetical protein